MNGISISSITCANGMPGHLALPAGGARLPAVIILHERYGFVRHPREVAEHFARDGMAGLAINGFFKCDFQPALADGSKRYYMTDPESVDYVGAAIEALMRTGRVDRGKIAVLGMCQTGRHPIVAGASELGIAAAICWYGAGSDKEFETGPYYPQSLEAVIAGLRCPFLGLFGDSDRHIPVANVLRMRALLERHGKNFDIRIYEDAPHGFLNDTMPERWRAPQAAAAWQAQMRFLDKAFNGGFAAARIEQSFAAELLSCPSPAKAGEGGTHREAMGG